MKTNVLKTLKIQDINAGAFAETALKSSGALLESVSPIDGEVLAKIQQATLADYKQVQQQAITAFKRLRLFPAPKRGEIVRHMGLKLREHKEALGALISLEMGKIHAEGMGEVQEMIDMADFAVGLSRQLHGLNIVSERPAHRIIEQWQPLGVVGIITAFNFPMAVWAWNAFLAFVCGNSMIWKPSQKTPLCALAVQQLLHEVLEPAGFAGAMGLVIGKDDEVGEAMIADTELPLISATGSCRMGKRVGEVVAKRFGRSLLELGGNNAVIVMDDARLDLALRAVVFGALGTSGQRCTSTRRLLLHEAIADNFIGKLLKSYEQVQIGDPLDNKTLMGPLIDRDAVAMMQQALGQIKQQGGEILYGGEVLSGPAYKSGCYVRPALVKARSDLPLMQQETFAPILYVTAVRDLETAVVIQNSVSQGLSSSLFTESLRDAEYFLSAGGSDCGIANINLGTSGAEIGGAFGGEKHTGGGRESGSDAWKNYMRRQTQTINASLELPLAQGIQFG